MRRFNISYYSQPTDELLTDDQLVYRHQARAGFLRTEPIVHHELRGGHFPLRWYELDGCLTSGSMDMLDICRLFNISPNTLHNVWVPLMTMMLDELASFDALMSSNTPIRYCIRDRTRGVVVNVDKMVACMPQLANILPHRKGSLPARDIPWPIGFSNSFTYPRVQNEQSLYKDQDFLLKYAKDYMAAQTDVGKAPTLIGALADLSIQA